MHDAKGYPARHPNMGVIALRTGVVSYKTSVIGSNGYPKEETYIKESYEEALLRLNEN